MQTQPADASSPPRRYTRGPALHGHHRVSFVELFFDLVFVFAITRLSHGLIAHPTLAGVYETALLTAAVWWVWIFTCWCTNWADPDKTPVRLMLFGLMALGLMMSIAIPKAFDDRSLLFAVTYVAMQFGRSMFMLLPMREISHRHTKNFQLITTWFAATGLLWISGAYYGGVAQLVLWTIAIAIELAGPALRFYVPGAGRSDVDAWNIEPGHFAERCGLFIILSLGESILVTGATVADLPWTFPAWMAFFGAFAGTIAMWWIYFNIGQERGAAVMAGAARSGEIGRSYTYVHVVIVAGIIVTAVGDEFALAHATGHSDVKTIASVIGGSALYLVGCALFKRVTGGWFPLSHTVGLAACALLAVVAHWLEPWLLSTTTAVILISVAVWESVSLGPDGVTKIGHPSKRAQETRAIK